MIKYKHTILFVCLCSIMPLASPAQNFANTPEEYDSVYAVNIRLSTINGVYIPVDLDEAHEKLIELSPTESVESFRNADEIQVCEKLHFGIGRWMILNWNFYEGSRLSHALKQKGLLHPDDMAQFILRTFHRKLNKRESSYQQLIEELAEKRLHEVNTIYKN